MAKVLKNHNRDRQIKSLYQRGYSLRAIGQRHSLSGERVRQILHSMNVATTFEAKLQKKHQKALKLYLKGMLPTDIYRRYKIKLPRVSQEDKNTHRSVVFWSKVDKKGADECWEWRGTRNNKTYYGVSSTINGEKYAHRIAFSLHNNKKIALHVLHSCDNPPCCNPKHLREGTPKENMQDRDNRGRAGWQRYPERLGRKRNTVALRQDCNNATKRYLAGEHPLDLGKEFGVHRLTICRWARVLNGQTLQTHQPE